MSSREALLEVKNLRISFPTYRGKIHAVNGISYSINKGEVMGIIGESGSGKSVEAYAVMGLLRPPGRVDDGHILFDNENIMTMTKKRLNAYRGKKASMIFQDPFSSLDPAFTIGSQLTEALRCHNKQITRAEAMRRSEEMLVSAGVNEPAQWIMKRYSFELSGGLCQRVMIAIALLCEPMLLIADEPTTALDVTVQAEIIRLLKNKQKEKNMSMLYITHNISIVAEICDMVSVMYGGYIIEQGTTDQIFYNAAHPYTRALLKATPRIDTTKSLSLHSIKGLPYNPLDPPRGCVFHPRCDQCMDICRSQQPPNTKHEDNHYSCCWLY